MNDFLNEYSRLCADSSRVDNFIKTGKDGTRIFNVLNTNIKTLKTLGEYIETAYLLAPYNSVDKQKLKKVTEFNFKSIYNKSDQRANIRSDIVIKAKNKFGGFDNAFVILILYLLLLDTGNGASTTVIRTRNFINSIPIFLKRKLYDYAKEIAASKPFLNDNIYLELVVYYGDAGVYREFIEFIKDNYSNEEEICKNFITEANKTSSPISKRLQNFQQSALKYDALYAVIFYSLDQFVRKSKMKGFRTGKKIINADVFLFEYLEFFNDIFDEKLDWLGTVRQGDSIDTLCDFIKKDLNSTECDEIHGCICSAFDLFVPVDSD